MFSTLQASLAAAREEHEKALQSHAEQLEQTKVCVARDIQQVWKKKMRLASLLREVWLNCCNVCVCMAMECCFCVRILCGGCSEELADLHAKMTRKHDEHYKSATAVLMEQKDNALKELEQKWFQEKGILLDKVTGNGGKKLGYFIEPFRRANCSRHCNLVKYLFIIGVLLEVLKCNFHVRKCKDKGL